MELLDIHLYEDGQEGVPQKSIHQGTDISPSKRYPSTDLPSGNFYPDLQSYFPLDSEFSVPDSGYSSLNSR